MSFVGYIPDREQEEKIRRLENERWNSMTPEERKIARENEIKTACLALWIAFLVSIPFIALFIWILLS